jgi:Peptidase_C39 like family
MAVSVPYFSQWESPELAGEFIDGSRRPADDPRWAASGASTPGEYEFWSRKVCGLACLKMVMAWRGLRVPPTMRLVERALAAGAYLPDGDRVRGLIYRPFADWVSAEYGIDADVAADLPMDSLISCVSGGSPVIASVHSWIRWPERTPPERGGHLVLVTGVVDGAVRLHNPSGIPGVSQRDALVRPDDFARFAAGRGIVIRRP